MAIHDIYTTLIDRLTRLRRTERIHQWLAGMGSLVLAASIVFLLMPVLGHWGAGSHTMRWVVALGAIAILAYFAYRHLILPLFRWYTQPQLPTDIDLALRIGKQQGSVRDRFANALQVYAESHEDSASAIRKALASAALKDAYERVGDFDFEQIVDRKTPRKNMMTGAAMLVACLFAWVLQPGYMATGFQLAILPHLDLPGQKLQMRVSPGDAEIVKGEGLEVSATIDRSTTETAVIEWKLTENGNATNRAEMQQSESVTARFSHPFEQLTESFAYRVRVEKESSKWYRVKVLEPPDIRSLQVTISYPAYTRRPPAKLDENIGDILALPGSKASVEILTNKEMTNAGLPFGSGDTLALVADGKQATCQFTIRREDTYGIFLEDDRGLRNRDPIQYRIELETDQPPIVRITFPAQDVDLDESMTLPLNLEAEDDYGFSSLEIVYELIPGLAGEPRKGRWPLTGLDFKQTRLSHQPLWDLSKLDMQPDDVVRYFAEVKDNDTVNGPKEARSEVYHIRFPSMYEIYEEVASQHEETTTDLQTVYEQAKKAKKQLDEVAQELKKNPKLDWEQQQKLSESAGATEKIQQNLEEIQQRLEQMVDTMERNDLMSMETLQKYLELQELLQKIDSPTLKKALEELQKNMQKLDPAKLEEAMKNLQFSQEDMLKSIERTLNLLQQLHAEQQLDEAIKKTEDLLKRQEEVNEQASQNPDADQRQQLSEEEKKASSDSKSLEKTLDELSQLMKQLPNAPSDKVEAASQMMKDNNLSGEMNEMAANMEQGEMSQAQQSGKKSANTLQQMSQSLQGARKEMSESHRREVTQALQKSTSDLVQLSKQQEQMGGRSASMSREGNEFNQAADKQQELLSGLQRVADRLYQVSQRSFAVTPEVARALGQTMNSMQQSLSGLEQRDGRSASRSQGQAMQGLDEAAAALREAMRQMGGAGSMSMGFEQFMQRMLGLSGQQQGINQETQQLGEQGMNAMQQQAAMARLAAEQAAVQKSLEQLMQEFGNRGEVLGRMDQTVRDMEDVVKDLEQRNVDRRTIDRQQQILSRMLDAQRSMRERDYSKERQAERSRGYRTVDPGEMPKDLGQRRSKIQEDLMRALREEYSRDYRELIQRYFEALVKQQQSEDVNQ